MSLPLLLVACFVVSSSSFADESLEQLVEQLGKGKTEVNGKIIQRGEAAVKPLAKLLRDKKADVGARVDAILLLGKIGGKNVVSPLRSALAQKELKYFAVIALQSVGPAASDALPDLLKMLRERATERDSAWGRRELIEAVGAVGHGSKDAAEVLALFMKQRDCYDAAQALAKLGEPGAETLVSLATKYLNDPRPFQDRRYGEALRVLNSGIRLPEEMIPVFKKHLLSGGKAARVAGLGLACVGPPAIPVLRELLDHKEADVRAEAAASLAAMNFNAFAARTYRGEKVPDPVSSKEFYPKLKKLYRLPNGELDWRIIHAMLRIDHDRCMSDPEMLKVLQEEFVKGLKRSIEEEKKKRSKKPEDGPGGQPNPAAGGIGHEPSPSAHTGIIRAAVPAGARVWIDGQPTDSIGRLRFFRTPILEGGWMYPYTLHVQWYENGGPRIHTRKVWISPGKTTRTEIVVSTYRSSQVDRR